MRRPRAALFVAVLGGALASACHRSLDSSDAQAASKDADANSDAPAESTGDHPLACYPLFHACTTTDECCAPNRCLNITGTPACQQEGPALDADSSEPVSDAAQNDGGQDAGIDADPFQCSTVTPLVLSDPMVISGTVAGGQTVTVQITMTDTDPSGYVSYPGVVLTSSTPGVSFAAAEAGPPGSSIKGAASKPITFAVKLDASIPPGTEVQITARAYGWGHPAPDCNGFVLSFSMTTT